MFGGSPCLGPRPPNFLACLQFRLEDLGQQQADGCLGQAVGHVLPLPQTTVQPEDAQPLRLLSPRPPGKSRAPYPVGATADRRPGTGSPRAAARTARRSGRTCVHGRGALSSPAQQQIWYTAPCTTGQAPRSFCRAGCCLWKGPSASMSADAAHRALPEIFNEFFFDSAL